MTSLEITGETPKDLVEAVTGIFGPRIVIPVEKEGGKDESVRLLQMETDLHDVRQEPMQAEEGLGTSSEEDTPLDKLAKDLRVGWGWLSDDMPIPADIRPNMLKASKVLGIISGYLKRDECIRVSALAAIGDAMK